MTSPSEATSSVPNRIPFTSGSATPDTKPSTRIEKRFDRCSSGAQSPLSVTRRQRAATTGRFHLAPSDSARYLVITYEKDTRTSRESHRRFRQWGPESVGVGRFYLDSDRRFGVGKNPATLHRYPR